MRNAVSVYTTCLYIGKSIAVRNQADTLSLQKSAAPERFPNGAWNCEADNWESFKPHLACNFYTQCSDGRDEDGCSYTRCHGDGFEVKEKCYILMRKQSTTTFEADEQCKDRGSRLARFDSVDEIRAVTKLLWKRQPFDFKVGLVEPFLDLPPM